MPGFVVSRGFGPGATPSMLIALGFVAKVADAARGALRGSRRAKQQISDFIEELKVSVALIAFNGKDLVNPIINTMRTSYKDKPTPRIEVTPTKLAVKQPDIKVKVTIVRSNNVDN